MFGINAKTFAEAVAIGFQSRGDFGIGAPGPLLGVWIGQQSDDVVLSLVVDPETASVHEGIHTVLADIIGSHSGHRWGLRIAVTGREKIVPGSAALYWDIETSEVHAPAASIAVDAASTENHPCGIIAGTEGNASTGRSIPFTRRQTYDVGPVRFAPEAAIAMGGGIGYRAKRLAALHVRGRPVMADAGGSAHDPKLFADTMSALDKAGIHAHTSDAVDYVVGSWTTIHSARLIPDQATHAVEGAVITMQAVLELTNGENVLVLQPVQITILDAGNPLCMPIIDMRHEEGTDQAA